MTIKLINRGTVGELLLEGRLDTNTAPDADAIFDKTVERFDRVVLNMEKLSYISSAGLRSVKRLHMAMRRKQGELTLKNVGPLVMEVFQMTGFSELLQFEQP